MIEQHHDVDIAVLDLAASIFRCFDVELEFLASYFSQDTH